MPYFAPKVYLLCLYLSSSSCLYGFVIEFKSLQLSAPCALRYTVFARFKFDWALCFAWKFPNIMSRNAPYLASFIRIPSFCGNVDCTLGRG